MPTRTTILLDEPSRRAAKTLAAKLDGVPPHARRHRSAALDRLAQLFEGNNAATEVKRLKEEDRFF